MKKILIAYCIILFVFSATAMETKTVLRRKLEERDYAMRFAFLQVNFQKDPNHSNNVSFPSVRNSKKMLSLQIGQVRAQIRHDIALVEDGKAFTLVENYVKGNVSRFIPVTEQSLQVFKFTLLTAYFSVLEAINTNFDNSEEEIKRFTNELPQKFFTTNTATEQRYEATKKHIQYVQTLLTILKTNDAKETIELCKTYNTLHRHPNLSQINSTKASKEFIFYFDQLVRKFSHKQIKKRKPIFDKRPAVYNLCLELQEKELHSTKKAFLDHEIFIKKQEEKVTVVENPLLNNKKIIRKLKKKH